MAKKAMAMKRRRAMRKKAAAEECYDLVLLVFGCSGEQSRKEEARVGSCNDTCGLCLRVC